MTVHILFIMTKKKIIKKISLEKKLQIAYKRKIRKTEIRRKTMNMCLIRIGKSYREISKILGVSLGSCVNANKILILREDLVYGNTMRQIINLLGEGVDTKTISEITGISIHVIIDMVGLIEERKYLEGIFEEAYQRIGVDVDFDRIFVQFWRDIALGSMYLEHLDDGKLRLVYKSYSIHEGGLKIEYFDDSKSLGIKLNEIYNIDNPIYHPNLELGNKDFQKIPPKQLIYSIGIDDIDIKRLNNGRFRLRYPNFQSEGPDKFIEKFCNSEKELNSILSKMLLIDGEIKFIDTFDPLFEKNGAKEC